MRTSECAITRLNIERSEGLKGSCLQDFFTVVVIRESHESRRSLPSAERPKHDDCWSCLLCFQVPVPPLAGCMAWSKSHCAGASSSLVAQGNSGPNSEM